VTVTATATDNAEGDVTSRITWADLAAARRPRSGQLRSRWFERARSARALGHGAGQRQQIAPRRCGSRSRIATGREPVDSHPILCRVRASASADGPRRAFHGAAFGIRANQGSFVIPVLRSTAVPVMNMGAVSSSERQPSIPRAVDVPPPCARSVCSAARGRA
jgi:hypothetical protein